MTLKEKINRDYIIAFKSRNAVDKSILSVVKGEIQNIEKNKKVDNLSDAEVTKILNKMVKSIRETIKSSPLNEDALSELVLIEGYLPKQMSEEEIREKVTGLAEDGATNIGEFMKAFAGLPVDRKLVGAIVKETLA